MNEQESNDNTKNKLTGPAPVAIRSQTAGFAEHMCLAASAALWMAVVVGSIRWHVSDFDDYWLTAPMFILSGVIPAAVYGLLRRSGRNWMIMAFSLMPGTVFALFLGLMYSQTLSYFYQEQPTLDKFVQMDFAKYEKTGSGQVRSDELQNVIDQQSRLRAEKDRLDYLKIGTGNFTEASPAAEEQLRQSLDTVHESLAARMISDEELSRLIAVRGATYRVGTLVQADKGTHVAVGLGWITTYRVGPPDQPGKPLQTPVYTATRSQLSTSRQILEGKFPLWFKVLHMLRWI